MTPERTQQLLPLMQAYAAGSPMQFRITAGGTPQGLWQDVTSPEIDWDQDELEWRIKPKSYFYRIYVWKNQNQVSTSIVNLRLDTIDEDQSFLEIEAEKSPYFLRWAGPRVEYTESGE